MTSRIPTDMVADRTSKAKLSDTLGSMQTSINTNTSSLADIATSISKYGAVGSDSTKSNINSSAIQQAINSLSVNGGTVFIPSKTYYYDTTITIPSNVKLVGLSRNASHLIYTGTDSAIKAIGSSTNYITEIQISNLTIEGNTSSKNGLELAFCTRSSFDNVTFKNHGIDGINIGYSWIIDFVACESKNNGRDGVRLDKTLNASTQTDDQNAIRFFGGNIEGNVKVGANILGGRNNSLIGVTIEGNSSEGVVISKSLATILDSLYLESNGVTNIKPTVTITDITDSSDNIGTVIKNCFIHGTNLSGANATFGISILGGYNAKVVDCTFLNNLSGSINVAANAKYTDIGQSYRSGTDPTLVTNASASTIILQRDGNNMIYDGVSLEFAKSIFLKTNSAIIESLNDTPFYLRSHSTGNAFLFDTLNASSVLTSRMKLDGNTDTSTLTLMNRTTIQLYPDANALPTAGSNIRGKMALITGAAADQLYMCRLNSTHAAYEWVQITT